MLNHITIMGRLTRDPELRRTGNGTAVASFALAVQRDRAAQGQEPETDFIDCVAWRQTGEFVSKYFTKGQMAVVSGRLQIRSWTDNDGNKRRTAEVVAESVYFGESKKKSEDAAPQQNYEGDAFPESMKMVRRYQETGSVYPQGAYDMLDGDDPSLPF